MKGILREAIETRRAFARAVLESPWDTKARTAADDLLIMYDEMCSMLEGICEHHWLPVGDWDGIQFDQCTKCNLFKENEHNNS